jgi:hypothetical protein
MFSKETSQKQSYNQNFFVARSDKEYAMPLIRREQELSDEYLSQLIADDPIRRNGDLSAFLSLLDKVQGGYSFFIDGKWGSGKTVFVKQSILVLKYLHGVCKENFEETVSNNIYKGLTDLQSTQQYFPVYYNAWENDVFSDPTVTLLGTLIAEFADASFGKNPGELSDKITVLADAILKPFGLNVITDVKKGFVSKDLLASMRDIQAVQSNFKALVSAMLKGRTYKLVLFIDELDRCSPAFALQLIERIKFLLAMDNVIIVFSTDTAQLTHTIEGYYGNGFNGSHYLTRYYDMRLTLKEIKPSDYLARQGFGVSMNFFDNIVQEMANHYSFSMRDCLRYLEDIESIRDKALGGYTDTGAKLLAGAIVPVIFAVKIEDSTLYDKILSGNACDKLLEIANYSSTFARYLEKYLTFENEKSNSDEPCFENAASLFEAVYHDTFKKDTDRNEARRARTYSWDTASQMLDWFFSVRAINVE